MQRQQQQEPEQRQQSATAAGRLSLLKGHLPPSDASPNAPLSWLQRSSSTKQQPAAAPPLDTQHGMMHLLAYLQCAWSEQEFSSSGNDSSSHATPAQQVVLLPPQLPACSISGLAHPWPPTSSHDHHLLRGAVIACSPALLLPAGASGCGTIDGLGRFLVSSDERLACTHVLLLRMRGAAASLKSLCAHH
jgi:hypothetical protein